MEKFIIFYATSTHYDSVVVDAESFNKAFEISCSFSRSHGVTIVGIFLHSSFSELNLYYHE